MNGPVTDPAPGREGSGGEREKAPETLQEQLVLAWRHIGGVSGTILTTIPVVVFVLGNALGGMWPAIWSSIGAAVLVGIVQLLRREKPTAVLASAVAVLVGAAKGYYLWGIWITFAIGILLLVSVIVRRPLIGLVWSVGNLHGTSWRADRRSRLYYDLATLFWTALCFIRFAVQNWLYVNDDTTWLGIARVAMGWPLTLFAILITIWAVRKVDARRTLLADDGAHGDAGPQRVPGLRDDRSSSQR
ncbi:DUF3159 domain-containing protein [Nonomuraea sp. NPDC050643]|uniref:DUF3159 domain-containing protein n=1 Tax=Nonomuraea sp. NPDC050643 TaxID=3155660 RepID=UPI0033DFB787